MSKVIIHIGPHKTGSSFIQAMMRQNLDRFPPHIRVWPKNEPIFNAMVQACIQYLNGQPQALDLISELAHEMGRNLTHDVLLMSNEDILGLLPNRRVQDTLYGGSLSYLPLIQSAFKDAGHDVQFVFYLRNYNDWLHSLYRYTYAHKPDRAFAPKRYKARYNLPENWNSLRIALTETLGADGVTFINYQTDRSNGRLGTALFEMAGMTIAEIDALSWIEPVNVSRPETVDPANW
jgi:hypothetical protein